MTTPTTTMFEPLLSSERSSGFSNVSSPERELSANSFLVSLNTPHSSPSPTTLGSDSPGDNGFFLGYIKMTHIKTVLNCGVIPILSVLGVLGNCLCVVVFRKQRYHSVAKPLLLAFCVSDILFLLATFLVNLPCIVREIDREAGHVFYVSMMPQVDVLRDVMSRVTVVMTLAIGVERCVAVTRPIKLRALCSVPRTRTAVLLIFFFVLALKSPAFFHYDVRRHVIQGNVTRLELHVTSFYLDNKHVQDFYFEYFLLVMLRALPFISTCVCFGVVLVSLKRRLQCACPRTPTFGAFTRAKGVPQKRDTEVDHGDLMLEERKLTKALLAVLLLDVVCELPGLVTEVYHVIRPDVQSSSFAVARDVSRLLNVFNSAINFVVFMKLYKHFSVTFKTIAGLCN